jgi:arsenite methyltransferase
MLLSCQSPMLTSSPQDMLARARLNAAKANVMNVSFVESPITSINLPSSNTDCIISNCVINLVPAEDKHLVFEEMFRLLKPGGRVAVSDILAKKEFPPDLQRDMALYIGCISGASLLGEYEKWLKDAGFQGSVTMPSCSKFCSDDC